MNEHSLINDLNQLRIFAEVARTSSITVAARYLGMPKSSVSRDVTRLEQSLGTPLLARNGRRIVLTEAGRMFADRAIRILEEINDAAGVVAASTSTARGVLTVQATYWLGQSLLVPLLPQFLERYPKIDVVLELKDFANLSTYDWDVQITAGTLEDSSFVARRINEISLGLYASKDYLSNRDAPRKIEDLVDHVIVDKHWANGTSPWYGADGTPLVAVKPRLMVNDMIAIVHAVRESAGIGWLPSFVIDQLPDADSLVNVLPHVSPPSMPVYAMFPKRHSISPKVRAFVDFIVDSLVVRGKIKPRARMVAPGEIEPVIGN